MRRAAAVAALMMLLSMPLLAASRDDGSPGRSSPIQRIVHFVIHLLDDSTISWPKP